MKPYYKIAFLFLCFGISNFVSAKNAKNTSAMENSLTPGSLNDTASLPERSALPTASSDQIGDTSSLGPKISLSLFESDPTRKLRRSDFLSFFKYSLFELTRGEAEQIFYFADLDKDALLSSEEWETFVSLYVYPFEACNADKNYTLNLEEFSKCYDADPKTKFISFTPKYQTVPYALIADSVASNGKQEINFSGYLLLRRALYGWQQCHSDSTLMNINSFKCALNTGFPNNFNAKLDFERMYEVGVRIYTDRSTQTLDFISCLRLCHAVQTFIVVASPTDSIYLEKYQFIKATKEGRSPSLLTEAEVEAMFQLINNNPHQNKFEMDFPTFAFYLNVHRLFVKYAQEKPLQLNQSEAVNLLGDPFAPPLITFGIDFSVSNISEAEYLEGSLVLQKLRRGESEFYSNFLELNSSDDANYSYYDVKPNVQNRIVFFKTFAGLSSNYWDSTMLLRAFTIANLFSYVAGYDKKFLVPASQLVDQITSAYDLASPPIARNLRTNYIFYKSIPSEVNVDLLTFAAAENWTNKINLLQNNNANILVNELNVKLILKDFGMQNLPDSVIDATKKGVDRLHRRQYDPIATFKNIIFAHANAAEHNRNQHVIQNSGIKINSDVSRLLLQPDRRFP